ncbi:MAG TPA: hypothetical protein VFD27_17705 [Chthoniobacteraceae bacterium]|nr:hypothetical protein [Chthoniobacteraceae bacterium]
MPPVTDEPDMDRPERAAVASVEPAPRAVGQRDDSPAEPPIEDLRRRAKEAPEECAKWVLQNFSGRQRERLIEETFLAWAGESPHAALDWLDAQADRGLLQRACVVALAAMARENPSAAIEWLDNHPSDASFECWQSLLNSWGATNPAQAAQWMARHLDVGLRDGLRAGFLAVWRDPAATDALLEGTYRSTADSALAEAARISSRSEPEFAIALAQRVNEPAPRMAAIEQVIQQWIQTDPSAARTFAVQHALPLPAPPAARQQPVPPIGQELPLSLPR